MQEFMLLTFEELGLPSPLLNSEIEYDGTVVKRQTGNQEVLGSNPTGAPVYVLEQDAA